MVLIFHDELISSQESHPLLANPPYNLTLTISELTTPKNPKEKREKSTDHDNAAGTTDSDAEDDSSNIPRPHNAFIIFRNDYAAKIKATSEQKVSIRLISQMASKQWKRESEMVKLFFKLLADMYQHRHRLLYPGYKYSPRVNASKKSKRRRMSRKSKAQGDESKGKKKGRIITWYIHDTIDKNTESKSDVFRHTDLNICNTEDLKIHGCFQQKTYPSQPATFINYTASPDTPLILHSTTTTTTPPIPTAPPVSFPPHYVNSENSLSFYDITSDNTSSHYEENASSSHGFILDPSETPSPGSPSNKCLFWTGTGTSNDNERDASLSHFGFFDFGEGQLFGIYKH